MKVSASKVSHIFCKYNSLSCSVVFLIPFAADVVVAIVVVVCLFVCLFVCLLSCLFVAVVV